MSIRTAAIALAVSLGLAAPLAAHAADGAAKPAVSKEVQAELTKLKKAAGAGEISAKEYKARKEALLAGASQTAKADGK
jgi:predicted secreted protein